MILLNQLVVVEGQVKAINETKRLDQIYTESVVSIETTDSFIFVPEFLVSEFCI